VTETPENNESEVAPPDEEVSGATSPGEDAGATPPAGEGDEQSARASSSADATPDVAGDATPDVTPEATPAASVGVTQADENAAPDLSEAEPEGADADAARAPSVPASEASESAPVTDAAAPPASEPEATVEPEDEEEYELAPREKPEIPGADLEPVFVPREEEEYLDAEAQAAAEAEAEAAAERARAEAEDEQAKPIADAAIDLAAGARYTATGKRKTAVARVILKPGVGDYSINGKSLETFFPRETLQRMIRQPLETVGYEARMDVIARMHGGGVSAQAGALRHGISRALIDADPNLRGELKRRGYLTRDPRVKERKKAGLKKARKRPQFSKR